MRQVFLNPDGTNPLGLAVIVAHSTGVKYANQCNGLLTELRAVEGYLVPCPDAAVDDESGSPPPSTELKRLFREHCRGGVTPSWTPELTQRLAAIVRRIPFWYSTPDGRDHREALDLDRTRLDDTVEAWVQVTTPVGPGTLVFENSD